MLENCPDGYVHGASCTLNCTHGYRLQGIDTVTCERDDSTHPPTMSWKWSGTDAVKPKCKEDNCPPLSPPKNGALSCYQGNNAWDCFMSCSALWDVPIQTEDRFVCSSDLQFWIPDFVPDCVARTRPGRVRMLAEVLYFAGSCDISTEQLRHTFTSRINQTIFGGVCSRIPTCVAENIEVKCGPVSSRRRRRSEIDDALLMRLRRTRRDVSRLTSHAVLVTFHVTMPYKEDSHTPEEAYKNYQEGAGNFIDQMRSQARSGFFNMNDLDLVTDETGLDDPVLHADCPPGTVYKVKRPQTRLSCVPK
ncbi:uncharacterized protein [Littorina saxatilis]|uniref:uncharacterized protein n=1 Tax=Littorina saxatilis TaxID=31220 RepID=UPI0038B548FA